MPCYNFPTLLRVEREGSVHVLSRWKYLTSPWALDLSCPLDSSMSFFSFTLVSSGYFSRLYFSGLKSLQMVTATMKLKDAYSLEGKL